MDITLPAAERRMGETMDRRLVSVLGGSGFLGRHIVRRLAADGWIVRVAVRDPEATSFLRTMGEPGQIVPVATDITNTASVRLAVKGATSVINLVGILYERGRRTFERIHVEGARTVAAASREAGAWRLVHVSAIGANPHSAAAYARTKALGEDAALAEFPEATILRPSVVFGPEDDFFNRFAAVARIAPVLPVFDTRLQPVYVADVARAVSVVLDRADTAAETYELGGPRVIAFREVMELVMAETGRRRMLLPVPFAAAEFAALFLERLPVPPLTRDQVKLLATDNVVAPGALGLPDLGIEATAVETILPAYLDRYRRPGRPPFRP